MRDSVLQLKWSEFQSPLYLYISPNNIVHLMIPFAGMEDIGMGTDNTCKALVALKDFFGIGFDLQEEKSVVVSLTKYLTHLPVGIREIESCPLMSTPAVQKRLSEIRARVVQVEYYLQQLSIILRQPNGVLEGLRKIVPEFDGAFKRLLADSDSNVYAVCLTPAKMDTHLKFQELYWFKAKRRAMGWLDDDDPQRLSYILRSVYEEIKDFSKIPSRKAELLNRLKAGIQEEKKKIKFPSKVAPLSNFFVDFFVQHEIDNIQFNLKHDDISRALELGEYGPDDLVKQDELSDLITCIFNSIKCEIPEMSGFAGITVSHVDTFSILTQFFLAEVNIYARIHNLLSQDKFNFAEPFAGKSDLSKQLAHTVKQAIEMGNIIELEICGFINQNFATFRLREKLNDAQQQEISKRFIQYSSVIKESEHKDEFIFLDDRAKLSNPIFHLYQGHLCCDFTKFYEEAIGNIGPDHPLHAAKVEAATMPIRLNNEVSNCLRGEILLGEAELLEYEYGGIYEWFFLEAIRLCSASEKEKEEALELLRVHEADRALKLETALRLLGVNVHGVRFEDSENFFVQVYKAEEESKLKFILRSVYQSLRAEGNVIDSTCPQFNEKDQENTRSYVFRLIQKTSGRSFAGMIEGGRAKRQKKGTLPPVDTHPHIKISNETETRNQQAFGFNLHTTSGSSLPAPAVEPSVVAPAPSFMPGMGSFIFTGSVFALGVGSVIVANTVSVSWIMAASTGFAIAGGTCPFLGLAFITLALVMGMGIAYYRNKEVEGSISNWVSRHVFCWGVPAANENDNALYSVH